MDVSNLKPHPLNQEIYGDTEIDSVFLESIKTHGILEPLVVKPDGTVISGHRRWKAAIALGLAEVPCRIIEYASQLAEQEAIIEYNRQRVKTFEQKMREADKLREIEEKKAKERQIRKPIQPKEQNEMTNISNSVSENFRTQKEAQGRTVDAVAAAAGFGSGRQYEKANKVWQAAKTGDEKAQEIITNLNRGDISVHQAYQAIKREEKIKAVEEKINETKLETSGFVDIYSTEKRYNIIYADPPWEYWSGGNNNQSLHYPVASIEEICSLPVKNIADENCILFLWVTYPILPESLKVIESWGFKYSTCGFVWVKKNVNNKDSNFFGCGSWTRANSELCLLATKGQMLRLDAGISQVIEAPIGEHSRKPNMVRRLITQLVGELPRIELFARESVDGWSVWGNEL